MIEKNKQLAKLIGAAGVGFTHGYLLLGALGGCLYLLGVIIDLVRDWT